MASQFPFLDWLNEQPELAYYSLVQDLLTPAQRRYAGGNYENTFNRYQGALGQQVRAGADPTLRFSEWLRQNPLPEQYAQLPFGTRNPDWTNYRPITRWMV